MIEEEFVLDNDDSEDHFANLACLMSFLVSLPSSVNCLICLVFCGTSLMTLPMITCRKIPILFALPFHLPIEYVFKNEQFRAYEKNAIVMTPVKNMIHDDCKFSS